MKLVRSCLILSVVGFLAAAGTAFAGAKQSLSFELFEPSSLGGKELSPGHYKVTWTGESDVKVDVLRGGKVVASAKGKFVERSTKAVEDAVVSRRDGSGMVLSEVRLGGRKSVLVLSAS
jgi:hypothetical protein